MRSIFLIFAVAMSVAEVSAQELDRSTAAGTFVTATSPILNPPAEGGTGYFISLQRAKAGRDHLKGALYGTIMGAVVGGVALAAVTYVGNYGSTGQGYWPLGLIVGAVPGGAVGLVIGAVIGVEDGCTDDPAELNARPIPVPNPRG